MLRLLKWLGGLALVAALGVVATAFWYSRAVLPALSGDVAVPGLGAAVEVVRDREGVPHVFAGSEADAAYALGYVHGQDRLWQMELNRRISSGRMSEVLGAATVDVDTFLRTLGVARSAEAIWKNTSPEARALLEAYAAGVNAYLATRSGPLPPEFLLTGAPAPEPWRPQDSIGWVLMMAWDLGENWREELFRMQLAQKGLTKARIDQFLPAYPGDVSPATADFSTLYKELRAETEAAVTASRNVPGHVEGMGSNNWVLGGGRTVTGKPILANDPHLGLSAPALWYFARLSAPGLDVIGATLPGVPGVVLGRNARIAWGFTNTGPDVQDLFIEKIDPADPNRYLTPDGPKPFEVVEERIKVKGAADVVLKVRISRHGPIISDGAVKSATDGTPKGHAIAFQWTALRPDNSTVEAAFKLNRARNWEEFKTAARLFHAPQQNMVFADVDGNIGYVAAGKVPVRAPDNDLMGQAPAPGWLAKYDWKGFLPFEELPQEYNPPRGFRATANEKITAPGYPHFIAAGWTAPYRADRIAEVLAKTEKHDFASVRALQADTLSLGMKALLPSLLAAAPAGDREKAARDLLAAWDGDMRADRREPLIAVAWAREFSRLVYADELGDLFPDNWELRNLFLVEVAKGTGTHGAWCDDVATPATEACPDRIARALTLALADLEKRYGAEQANWRWGAAHQARSEHRPFARVASLARFFDVRVETPGDTYTVNVGRHTVKNDEEPFVNRHAASLRGIYDLADPEKSVFVHSTGQSGIVFSPLYRNLAERWAKVEFIPMKLDRKAAEDGALGTLKLRPR